MSPDDPNFAGRTAVTEADAAMLDDLRLRLLDSQEREQAARTALRRSTRELALMRRLARYARTGAPPTPPAKVGVMPRCSAVPLLDQPIYHLDLCENRGEFTFVAGWAFHPNPAWNGRDMTVTLLLRNADSAFYAVTGKLRRPDVATLYAAQAVEASGGARGLESVGFACEILHASLPAGGEWRITLRLECGTMLCEETTDQWLRL